MDNPIRRPEEILAYRPLRQILGAKPRTCGPSAPPTARSSALQIMADKDIGFLVVLEQDGAWSASCRSAIARDAWCWPRKRRRRRRSPTSWSATSSASIPTHTFADCLRLMHQHGIRHLPVVDSGKAVAVVSIRDLLGEAVAHHAKIIAELERERLTIFTSTA